MALRLLYLNSMLSGGGTDDRSVATAQGLMALGHKVWLAGPEGRDFSRIVSALGIPLVPLPLGLIKLPLIWKLAGLIKREKIQIIQADHGRDYWPVILAARLSHARPKVVLARHLAKSPSSWLSRHFLLSQCDALIAVSQFVAKVLREGDAEPCSENPERHYRPPLKGEHSKIRVIYGGFDVNKFVPKEADAQRKAWRLQPGHFAFGVVGAYHLPRGKGQPEFLRAAALIREKVPHARFLIIGKGDMQPLLATMLTDLRLSEVAQLTPYCYDMPSAMNALDCLILPQVGTEAFPGVLCEAFACGKPVIASALDGIPEAFAAGGYGQLVRPAAIEELAQAMSHWAQQPRLDLAARLQLHNRIARQFSLERAARDLSSLYESLIANQK